MIEIFSFHWLSFSYFTKGLGFFFREEAKYLFLLNILVVLGNIFLGCTFGHTLIQCGIVILVRRIAAGGICTSSRRFNGETIIITGSNTGIGRETARDLAARGAKVILACRNIKKAEEAAKYVRQFSSGAVQVMKLDLSSFASIQEFAAQVKAKEKKIYCLINNAGAIMVPYTRTADGFESHMGVNHLGHFLLTNLLLPLLSGGHEARIINVTSLAHAFGEIPFDDINSEKNYDRWQAYSNSKLANILFTRQLAKRLRGTNIQVFAVHPGSVLTNAVGQFAWFMLVFGNIFKLIMKNPMEGAQTTICCATEAVEDPHCYFSDCKVGVVNKKALSESDADRLWDLSEKLVGLK